MINMKHNFQYNFIVIFNYTNIHIVQGHHLTKFYFYEKN
jgi:hypothetical protein